MSHSAPPTDVEPERLGAAFIQDPHALYARLREDRPVHPVWLPRGLKVWLVTRYADARATLADSRLSKDMRGVGDLFDRNVEPGRPRVPLQDALGEHMLNADPPGHDRLRRLVNKAFTARRVEQLRPRVERITSDLLDAITSGAPDGDGWVVDLLDAFAFPLPITVIGELLGVPGGDRDDFRAWSTALIAGGEDGDQEAAGRAMVGYLSRLIEAKRAEPGADLYSALIDAHDDGDRLSANELVSMGFLLLVAGHETTVNLIANGTLALIDNPDQLAALRADRSLLRGAIEEFLRYEGPVNNATLRYTTAPTEIGGVLVPAGQFVVASLCSANRDGARFPDPDRLDIGRDTGGHVAFGYGIHYCLGAPLARLEAEVAFTALLDRFDRLELAVPSADLRWRAGMIIRGLERFPVRLAGSADPASA